MRIYSLTLAAGLTLMIFISGCTQPDIGYDLEGGGVSLAFPTMSGMSAEYKKSKGKKISYQSVGSGAGMRGLIDKKFDFCCVDAPPNGEQIKEARGAGSEILQIPLMVTAVVPVYNLPEVSSPLKFTGPVLADIFLGKITRWNDTALSELNPTTKLPDIGITPIYRSDASGTTLTFTQYLSSVSPEWKRRVGFGTSVNWPFGLGSKQSSYLEVHRIQGSITYLEFAFAAQNNITCGMVRNRAGRFREAAPGTLTSALEAAAAASPKELDFSLADPPGQDSYPICGCVWVVVFQSQPSAKREMLLDFLKWITHDGQNGISRNSLGPLPQRIVEAIERRLAMVQEVP